MERVQSLGCVVCRNEGHGASPAEVHHLLKSGRRMGHRFTIPLCPPHHRPTIVETNIVFVSRHPYKKRFESKYGTELELLEQTNRELEAIYG